MDDENRQEHNNKNAGDAQRQSGAEEQTQPSFLSDSNHSPLNVHGGSFLPEEFLDIADHHNGFAFDPADFPTEESELFKKPPPSQGPWTWPEGWGEKKLKEYCEIVRDATAGHWDEARRKVFMFGRWVGGGAYDEDKARDELKQAARQCIAPDDYVTEVVRGFNNGVKEPAGPIIVQEGTSLDDFRAYLPQHKYIYLPTRELWPVESVNARFPSVDKKIKANLWLDQNRPVEQMTWAPGEPMLIKDRLIVEGGWVQKDEVTCFNLYKGPTIEPGDGGKAGPWIEHVHKVFGESAEHIIKWCAHRVQHPEVKINHALLLGSESQGVGKDAALEPVKRAIGPWNFGEASPQQLLGRFNSFLKSIILRVREVRDLGDVNRYQFYNHTKAFTAPPPDVLRVDEKHVQEYSIINCVGLILTTNYKTTGIYLPADDRRHFVAWSHLTPQDFEDGYWNRLWGWYDAGGDRHVAGYLIGLDLAAFDPKVPPPKTQAFWDIVDANRAPEDSELADVLDQLGNPIVVTLRQVILEAHPKFAEWLDDPKNQRVIPFRFEQCGYERVRNPDRKDGFWKIEGQRQVVYGRGDVSLRERIEAVGEMIKGREGKGEKVIRIKP